MNIFHPLWRCEVYNEYWGRALLSAKFLMAWLDYIPKILLIGDSASNRIRILVYTQYEIEWPFLSDRFWSLVYFLKKIVSNSLVFSKINIQVIVSGQKNLVNNSSFGNFAEGTIKRHLSIYSNLHLGSILLLKSLKRSLRTCLCEVFQS